MEWLVDHVEAVDAAGHLIDRALLTDEPDVVDTEEAEAGEA